MTAFKSSLARTLLMQLADAPWLDGSRARAYALILGGVQIAGLAIWLLTSKGGLDLGGKPLGTDFISFWAASHLALTGDPALVYVPEAHRLAEAAVFPGSPIGYYGFFYPPAFLLLCLPLAALPYLGALALWLGATGSLYVAALRRLLPAMPASQRLLCLAFPAILLNAAHGQNGFLSAALFASGILLLDKRPIVSGLVFGCLIFKPQLGVLLPLAFALRGNWRAFLGAGLSAAGLMLASLLVLGADTWRGFVDIAPLARAALELQLVGPAKMVSAFAALQLWGAPTTLAYGAQGLTALAAVVVLGRLAKARVATPAFGAALVAATLLTTPFVLDYDLTLLAIPLAFLFRRGSESGFLPYEKLSILIGVALPLIARPLAMNTGLPLAPFAVAAVLAVVARRALQDAAIAAPSRGDDAIPERDFVPSSLGHAIP